MIVSKRHLAISSKARGHFSWRPSAFLILLGLLSAACTGPGGDSDKAIPSSATQRTLAGLGLVPRLVNPGRPLQCVPYARRLAGIEIRGDADTWWQSAKGRYQRSDKPRVGSVLVIRSQGRSLGHLAVVTKILNDREIVANHANWLNRGRIHQNTPIIDVSPRGDWSAVRVWYTPGKVYGKRRYAAHGFIHSATATASR